MASEIKRIGAAADIEQLLRTVAEDPTVTDLVVVYLRRDESGEQQATYGHSRTQSRMALVGALTWAAHEIATG